MSRVSRFLNEKALPYVPRFIRHDFWRKLFALFFAVLLTVSVNMKIESKMERVKVQLKHVPVRFVADGGFKIVPLDDEPMSANVVVEVPSNLKDLKDTDLLIECPVTMEQIDTNVPMKFDIGMVKRNRSIENMVVQEIHPDALLPNIDYVSEKDVPVKVVYDSGEVLEGYRANVAEPDSPVRIRGPEKALANISHLETEKIPLSNVTRSFSCQAQLILPSGKTNRNIEILSDTVRVEVEIRKNDPHRVDRVPVQVLFGRSGANTLRIASIQPEFVTVLFYGGVLDVAKFPIHPILNLSDITKPGVYTVDIKCWSDDDNISEVEVFPAQATVTLEPAAPSATN